MYKLLKDKNNEFQCEIKLEGTSDNKAKARLFLEADGCEYSFPGVIQEGKCIVPMGKLKKFQNLLESGKIRLEIIADDTLFVPYESDYILEQEKKVTVEVIQPASTPQKPLIEVKVEEPTPTKNPINEIKQYLNKNTKFDGTSESFIKAVKNPVHKEHFNNFCKENKLDVTEVLKQILK